MKKNSLIPKLGIGAALLALTAFASVSHAEVIVNNLPGSAGTGTFPSYSPANPDNTIYGQVFTMPNTTDTFLTSVSLSLNFTGTASASVYLYSASTTTGNPTEPVPTNLLQTLGTVSGSTANQTVSLTGLNYSLTSGSSYALVLGATSTTPAPNVTWNFTLATGSSGGTAGTLADNSYYYNNSYWRTAHPGEHEQMKIVTAVPEPSAFILTAFFGKVGS